MQTVWLSYVPHHVAADLLNPVQSRSPGESVKLTVVALFADVSGFTALSEALGKSGRSGTEELTTLLNSYFEPMIDLIHTYGGIIGKFSGDAMTVLFPFNAGNKKAVVRRAIQCAVEMQSNMSDYQDIPTSAGPFSLAMKAGLALGPVICTTVGVNNLRLEYVVAGSVLDRCAEAEHLANKGEIVIDNSLLHFAGQMHNVKEGNGFSSISFLKRRPAKAPLPNLPAVDKDVSQVVADYIHPNLVQRIKQGQSGFINEHRLVTVMFVRFSDFDYDHDPGVGEALQIYLSAVIKIIARYDGYLNKIDMGDKGSKFIVLFGAPLAHEDDETRAIHCALELKTMSDIQVQIGISTGFVYCGRVGSRRRQEYTVMGDTVNLATRLMQHAQPDQILISERTHQGGGNSFRYTALPPIRFKGKSFPLKVYAVQGLLETTAVSRFDKGVILPFVGRQTEINQIEQTIQFANEGRGRVIGITAGAGVGKTRFSSECIQLAVSNGFSSYVGTCQSYGRNRPYLVWREIWRAFFNLDNSSPIKRQIEILKEQLTAVSPRLLPRLPLLNPLLNLPIPDNHLTRVLEGQLKVDSLKSLLLECVRKRCQQQPLLFVLDDCHWIDDLSAEILAFIGRNAGDLPLLIFSLYRTPDADQDPLQWATDLDPVTIIHLPDLEEEEAQTLARLKLKQLQRDSATALPLAIEHALAKAQGNPFYLEEMIYYLHERLTDFQDADGLAAVEIPDSLHNVIISRLDQLAEAEKTTLKVASVIGRTFRESWLWGSYPALGEPRQVQTQLRSLQQKAIIYLQERLPEPNFLFKQITTQEVAYESLAYATRTQLHENIGHFIEHRYADDISQYFDILAFHYGRSPNLEKQRTYFHLAGDAAKIAYANKAAIAYFSQLLPLLHSDERGEVLLKLGQVYQLVGQWKEAEKAYQQALNLAHEFENLRLLADCQLELGRILLLSQPDQIEDILNAFNQAIKGYQTLDDNQGIGQTFEEMSIAYSQNGNYELALDYAQQRLTIARQYGDKAGESGAYDYIGLAYVFQGKYQEALSNLKEAVAVASKSSNQHHVIRASNNLAGVYWEIGDFQNSLKYIQQALQTANEIGHLDMTGLCLGNIANIYQLIGDFLSALEYYQQALAVALEIGNRLNIPIILDNIGNVFAAIDRLAESYPLYRRAIELVRPMNLPHLLCEFLTHKADCSYKLFAYAEGLSDSREALSIATQIGHEDMIFQATLLTLRFQLALAELNEIEAIQELTQMQENWSGEEKQAALAYEIWQITRDTKTRKTVAALYQSLYDRSPQILYQQRYQELTEEKLPAPPPLPELGENHLYKEIDLNNLLQRVGVNI